MGNLQKVQKGMVNNDKCCGFLGLQFLTHKHIVTGGVQDWWCAMAKCGWWPDQIRGNYWCGFVIACLSTDHVWKTSRIISFLLMLNTPEKPWYAIGAIHFGCPWGGNMSCSFSMQRDGNKVVVFISETKRYRKFEALSLAGGINAYINDQLSDESIYEDVDKLMKDHKTWQMWMNCWFSGMFRDISRCKGCDFISSILPESSNIIPNILPWILSHAHFSKFTNQAGRQGDSWQDHGHSFPERFWGGTEGCSDLSGIWKWCPHHFLCLFLDICRILAHLLGGCGFQIPLGLADLFIPFNP